MQLLLKLSRHLSLQISPLPFLSLLIYLLPPPNAEPDLDKTSCSIARQRDKRQMLPRSQMEKAKRLSLVQEKLSCSGRIVAADIRMLISGNEKVIQPHLPIPNPCKCLLKRSATLPDTFHLSPSQHNACLKFGSQVIEVPRPPLHNIHARNLKF